jgi:hypothetical protein
VPRKPTSDDRSPDVDDLLPELGLTDAFLQRPAGIGSVRHAIVIALAATVSWLVADAVSESVLPLFAPVTTLLVVQASPWSTLGVSVQRILGTGLGVLVASVYVNLLGLSWWSFLIGVLAALLIARALPWSIGGQLQIPVTVVFVLAIGPGSISQDVWRVLDVVVGGVIGVIAVFVFPSRPSPEPFEASMRRYRDAVIAVTRRVGDESGHERAPLPENVNHAYVYDSRRLQQHGSASRLELERLGEATTFNVRARRVPAGLEARAMRLRRLIGIGLQVRGLVGAANDLYDRDGKEPTLRPDELAELLAGLVDLMHATLGSDGEPVGQRAAAEADERSQWLAARVQGLASIASARHDQVGEMLESVSVLGRVDHIRRQLDGYPQQEA